MDTSSNTKRIAKNTLMLYFRQILIMGVSLYTVRIVLNVLGAENYGIYDVVAGVVTMFSFLSNSMATASQRYFSFDLGKGNIEKLKVTYGVTFLIYIFFAFIIILIAETIGLWVVNNKLVIPENRLFSANLIYQSAIVSFLFTLLATPYMACIIAHEDMTVYAYVSIIEVFLKLAIVFAISYFDVDKLSLYGILLAGASLINTLIYRYYCNNHYLECKEMLKFDKKLFKELISYSSWNLFGSFASVCKGQITNIVLNMFFGPVVNAARGISSQVNSAVASFAQNFTTAMRPQIIKYYAVDKQEECFNLVYRGCKFTFFLMYIITLPLFLEMDYVLDLWLKNPPEGAVLFTRLVLLETLIDTLSYQLMTLSQATGKIKLYQAVVGGLLLLNLPFSYLALKLGCSAYSVCVVSIIIAIIAIFFRLVILKIITDLSVCKFIQKVLFPCCVIILITFIPMYFIVNLMSQSFFRLCMTVFISFCLVLIATVFFGLNRAERCNCINIIISKFRRK